MIKKSYCSLPTCCGVKPFFLFAWRTVILALLFPALCASLFAPFPVFATTGQFGKVSWYGDAFHGKRTASGRTYDKNDFTAAHRQLAFGTVVRVYSLRNNSHVLVEVTDRGPYGYGRVVDVSKRAAKELGLVQLGVGQAVIEVVSHANGTPLKAENAFYLRLTPPMPGAKAKTQLTQLQQKLRNKPILLLHANPATKPSSVVALGPYRTFKQARNACDTLGTGVAHATIIEANKHNSSFARHTPPKAVARKVAVGKPASLTTSKARVTKHEAPKPLAKTPLRRQTMISSKP